MNLIHPQSLSETLNAVEEAIFYKKVPITATLREKTAAWIAGRQGLPEAYRGTFALFEEERGTGGTVRVFTGERVKCAAARHIMGEEAMRALRLLKPRATGARAALERAAEGIRLPAVGPVGRKPDDGKVHWLWQYQTGTYCCGACSVALWRNLLAGGFDRQEERLAMGLKCLRSCRKGDGQWRAFPYWYTLLALAEMDLKSARAEMLYAAGRCERAAKRVEGDVWSQRRGEVARRVLAKV